MLEPLTTSATARFICDSLNHDFVTDPAPEFSGRTVSDCAKQARLVGWKFSNKGNRCFCPKHQTVQKPPPSLFEQAMAMLEAVTNLSGTTPARPITDCSIQPECVFCHQFMWGTLKHSDTCVWLKARMFIEEQHQNALHRRNAVEVGENTSQSNTDIQTGSGRQ